MTMEGSNYVPVSTTVVLQTLVEAVNEKVQERRAGGASEEVLSLLQATDERLTDESDETLERDLRLSGYLARVVEVEMFEPARRSAEWAPERVRGSYERTRDWSAAVTAVSVGLARAEPIERPDPDDPDAMSWQVPGPGGHVRHYVARRAIEELLRDREEPIEGDPADLKRPWMYGFFVRTCEEALPDDAALEPQAG